MVRDTLSDFVARIKNGYMAQASSVSLPYSRTAGEVARVLVANGYVDSAKQAETSLVVTLKYENQKPAITDIARVSKPGSRTYVGYRDMPRVWGGLGIHVVSTPKGVMTDKQAKKLKVGGELLCKVW